LGNEFLVVFGCKREVRDEFGDVCSAFVAFIAAEDAHYPEASTGPDGLLVERDLGLAAEGSETDEQLVGDLAEIVEQQQHALLHGVQQRPADVLKLSEFLLAHKVSQQGVEFHSAVEPQLQTLRPVVVGEVVSGDDALLGQLNVYRVEMPRELTGLLVYLLPDSLLQRQQIVDQLPHSQRVFLADCLDFSPHLEVVFAVQQCRQTINPQRFLVAATRKARAAFDFDIGEVDRGNEADYVESFQQKSQICIHLPIAAAHHLLERLLGGFAQNWMTKTNESCRSHSLSLPQQREVLVNCEMVEYVDEVIGVIVENLLGMDVLEVEGQGRLGRCFLLSLNSLHSLRLLNAY
jgi:hypothetical protein